MKQIINILILITFSNSLYAYYDYYNYLQDSNSIRRQEIRFKNERIRAKEIERSNEKARIANEKYYRSLKRINRHTGPAYIKKTYHHKNFKNKPQIILDDLHIIGIKSIKPFKKNKYIIKAANGTFALPKDKFNEAKKINFTPKLMKIQ